jgi:pimeloyl-ACP methyl ester carboxylesterase
MPELVRAGVRLVYDEAGSLGPPLLCVHGFGGDGSHFAPQLEYFQRSRRVVALDRRGHGRSDKPDGPYSIPDIAEEVIWTARELGLTRPVVVAHSMGVIGFEIVKRDPSFASALVVLDAPLFAPPPVRAAFDGLLQGLRSPQYRAVIDDLCDKLIFLPTDDKARRTRLHNDLLATPQAILAATWENLLAYDPTDAIAACQLPLLYVGGVMPCDEARLRELCPHAVLGRAVGAGHFPQLEVPEQINAMIERFLRNAQI